MNLKRIESLLKLLRANNVSHFKSLEIEVRIDVAKLPDQPPIVTLPGEVQIKAAAVAPITAAAAPPVEMEIPHHVNEVNKLLKLSDEDLVEKLFPDLQMKVE